MSPHRSRTAFAFSVRPSASERVGSDAGAVLGQGVILAKNLVVSSESGLAKGQHLGRTTYEKQQAREMATRATGLRMLGAEHPFAYRQRALVERPRPRKVALVAKQDGEGF